MKKLRSTTISAEGAGERLDAYLTRQWPAQSRTFWQKQISTNHILVNGQPTKEAYRVQVDDVVVQLVSARKTVAQPDSVNLKLLYRDDDVLVVDKPAGLVVYPPAGSTQASVVSSLRDQIRDTGPRPGVVHRLDRDTSGVLILARHPAARDYLIDQFKHQRVKKTYLVLVQGHLEHEQARIELPIGRSSQNYQTMRVDPAGKLGVLEYSRLRRYETADYLSVRLLTGRTHQIRVQLSYLGHPVVGDKIYGRAHAKAGLGRQFLHAHTLSLSLPNGRTKTFTSPLPGDLQRYLSQLHA